MFKKQKLKRLVKPSLRSKIGFVNLNKVILSNNSYSITYSLKGRSLVVNFLKQNKSSNLRDLKNIYTNLLKISKEKNAKRIVAETWIFMQKKDLAKTLGFNLLKGSDKKINLILKKFPDYKIKGIEQRMSFNSKHYGVNIYLVLENKKINKLEYVYLEKNTFPVYVKEL